jgi:hypothetical protein
VSDDAGVLPTDIGLHVLWERSAELCTLTLHHVEVEPLKRGAVIVLALPDDRRE